MHAPVQAGKLQVLARWRRHAGGTPLPYTYQTPSRTDAHGGRGVRLLLEYLQRRQRGGVHSQVAVQGHLRRVVAGGRRPGDAGMR